MRGRRHTAAALLVALPLAACSLLLSTSDLDGPGDPASAGAEAGEDGVATGEAGAAVPNLIGSWSFEEQSGRTAQDSSGQGNHGQLGASVTWTPDGARGGAVRFAGNSDAVTVASLAAGAFPTSGTLSLWFRYTFAENDPASRSILDDWTRDRGHIFLRRPNGTTDRTFQVALQPHDVALEGYTFVHRFDVASQTWVHVVLTWDAVEKAGAFYVDGTVVLREAYKNDFSPNGQRFVLGQRFIGEIDEVRLYDRALAEAEVATLP